MWGFLGGWIQPREGEVRASNVAWVWVWVREVAGRGVEPSKEGQFEIWFGLRCCGNVSRLSGRYQIYREANWGAW